jgi:hypothetical protein
MFTKAGKAIRPTVKLAGYTLAQHMNALHTRRAFEAHDWREFHTERAGYWSAIVSAGNRGDSLGIYGPDEIP